MNSSVYKGRSGQWAFIAHRVAGFLVLMFLLMHVVDVSLINHPKLYNEVHQLYGRLLMRLFEVGLLAALVFHSLNGFRIVMIDFFPHAIKRQKQALTVVCFLTAVSVVVGGYIIMKPMWEH